MQQTEKSNQLPSWLEMKCLAMLYKLEGLEVFSKLSPRVMDEEWNGLGPDRFPRVLRDFLDRNYEEVLPAACIHDFRFVIGGSKKDFHNANAEMKRNMIRCLKANRQKFTLLGYWLARLRVLIAKKLCDSFGYEGWTKKS